jgi:hypothetical protein
MSFDELKALGSLASQQGKRWLDVRLGTRR